MSSGESESRALTRAGCEGMYLQQMLLEVGIEATVIIETDASAAFQAAGKLSGGRLRHMTTAEQYIRQLVKQKKVG